MDQTGTHFQAVCRKYPETIWARAMDAAQLWHATTAFLGLHGLWTTAPRKLNVPFRITPNRPPDTVTERSIQ